MLPSSRLRLGHKDVLCLESKLKQFSHVVVKENHETKV